MLICQNCKIDSFLHFNISLVLFAMIAKWLAYFIFFATCLFSFIFLRLNASRLRELVWATDCEEFFILLAQTYVAFLQHGVESSGGGGSGYGGCGDGTQKQLSAMSTCVKKKHKTEVMQK